MRFKAKISRTAHRNKALRLFPTPKPRNSPPLHPKKNPNPSPPFPQDKRRRAQAPLLRGLIRAELFRTHSLPIKVTSPPNRRRNSPQALPIPPIPLPPLPNADKLPRDVRLAGLMFKPMIRTTMKTAKNIRVNGSFFAMKAREHITLNCSLQTAKNF